MSLVLVYGLLKGVREILKKKALTRNTVMEVLFLYTLISFVIVIVSNLSTVFLSENAAPQFGGLSLKQYLAIGFKSFVIFIAWICSFYAIKKLPISLYGILDLARVLFSMFLGVVILQEKITLPKAVGFILVCTGLVMLRWAKKEPASEEPKKETNVKEECSTQVERQDACETETKTATVTINATPRDGWKAFQKSFPFLVILALISCLFNAVSGTMDKILMKNMTSGQLQFWYMLFLTLMYLVYILVTKTPMNWKSCFTNHWVWILSIAFVIADRCLFIANSYADSQVTIMTLIKQSGCIVTILGGRFIFHEKNIRYKLICASVIIAGIVVAVL